MEVISGIRPGPRKILFYGEEGVGKSTFASECPGTYFLDVEEGLEDIDCKRSKPLTTIAEVVEVMTWLNSGAHEFKTVAVDTLDWLEKLIHKEVAIAANKPTVGDIPFQRGYDLSLKKWDFLLSGFSALHKKGMGVILLAHDRIVKVNEPGMPMYERREPDLHHTSSSMIREWCQDVLYAQFRVFTRTEDAGFGRERTIATGGKERFIQTTKSAGIVAKNRVKGMPDEIPLSWATYASYVRAAYASRGEVIASQVSMPEVPAPEADVSPVSPAAA